MRHPQPRKGGHDYYEMASALTLGHFYYLSGEDYFEE